jgi:hypothetical protein
MEKDYTFLNVKLNKELKTAFKEKCSINHISMQDAAVALIDYFVKDGAKMNKKIQIDWTTTNG